IKEALKNQKQVCVLIPEILLINRFKTDLRSYFGDNVACFHSRLLSFERYENWRKVKEGKLSIALGTRSAVFAPLKNLGLIIVDEEHDPSYKQEDLNPRYHARDVAIKRGETEGGVIILGSATPSLESFYNAREGKYVLCRLKEMEKPNTQLEIVNMHQERKEGNFSPFSRKLSHLMEEKLSKKEKVALFLNRRGFSKVVKCQDCGFVYRCPNCNISLTFHQIDLYLRCHFCNFKTRAGATCPQCQGHNFSYAGVGTERINQEIKTKFPWASIIRMDLDAVSSKDTYQRISEGYKKEDFDLILGTQMITREWDLPEVGLVGVISADFSLDFPDFRSREKTFQLLTQVFKMAREKGEILIQTSHPEDWSIKLASQGDFLRFYELEIKNREELNYPPFSHLILILFSGIDKKMVIGFSRRFASKLKKKSESDKNMEILGPAPAPLFRIRGKHRYQILLKTQKPEEAVELIDAVSQMKSLKKSSSVRITINVDPMEMM
ncbi:MAG: primosomal protein N', partial [Candidatus Zixiibacteriota bacterium]